MRLILYLCVSFALTLIFKSSCEFPCKISSRAVSAHTSDGLEDGINEYSLGEARFRCQLDCFDKASRDVVGWPQLSLRKIIFILEVTS